jgi:hypothetical protein
METALMNNAKIVVPTGSDLVNVMSEMGGIVPVKGKDVPPTIVKS